jgi:hypothetical protein
VRDVRAAAVLLLALATAALGCESGWDVDGRVLTQAVKNKDRALLVYLVTEPKLDLANLPKEPWQYDLIAQAERIPEQSLPFSVSEFGCHQGEVAIVAWAPASRGGADAGAGTATEFAPKAGDLVAVSDIRRPYCGPRTEREHIDVILKEE